MGSVLNIGNPETGERYQLDGERAREYFVDQYKPAGFVLYDRDGGKPDQAATRELVRAVNAERAPKKATEPAADAAPEPTAEKGKKG